ncbi:hypothetical protein LINPERHAP1_LOCUS8800 [Linum perenne]
MHNLGFVLSPIETPHAVQTTYTTLSPHLE